MTLKLELRGCVTCLWRSRSCLIRGNKCSSYLCPFYAPFDPDRAEIFEVEIKKDGFTYHVFLNGKRLRDPIPKPGAPAYFLAYKLLQFNNFKPGSYKIIDPRACEMLNHILNISRTGRQSRSRLSSKVIAFCRYLSRVGVVYAQNP